ncbi:hypothetical protein ACFXP7_04565 [Microbacterium sp. P06]|uniref:hypothetical protein n=1 Tax=Microbacterium sp. P06 TaxID=3366949 RepID=UPI00374779ED
MDPLWELVAVWWWIGPAAAGAGTLGWIGVVTHRERSRRPALAGNLRPRAMSKGAARRLELDAAVLDLQSSRDAVSRSRAEVQVAQAELLRAQAEGATSRTSPGAVAAARARVQAAQRQVRAAIADVRARRAGVRAARVTLPAIRAGRDPLPLDRLLAQHDELTARWLAYETDAGLQLTYPAMTDVSSPHLAVFLREQSQAQWLRPASRTTRMTPAEFLAYRDAVRRALHAFDDAEREARRRAGETPPRTPDAASEMWNQVAQGIADNAQRAVARSAEAVGRAARDRFDRARSSRSQPRDDSSRDTSKPADAPPEDPGTVPPAPGPTWPVPGRDRPKRPR